ncbi:MAG: flagellar biosynthetic protein FliQ [Armatimonadota bacterium]
MYQRGGAVTTVNELTTLIGHVILMTMYVATPPVAAALLAGFAFGWLQNSVGTGDPAVGTAPRLLAVGVAVLIFGTWMVSLLGGFWYELWSSIPELVG